MMTTTISPLRKRMIEDMDLAGLKPSSQQTYLYAVKRLAAHYGRSPNRLSEEDVRVYIVGLQAKDIALGTFKTNLHGIRFLFRNTLGRDWDLFSKKRSDIPNRSGFPMLFPIRMPAAC